MLLALHLLQHLLIVLDHALQILLRVLDLTRAASHLLVQHHGR